MKKKALLTFVFAIVATMWTGMAQAQTEDYELIIAGAQVTSDNCNDLSVIDGVKGNAKYDPATKTLTLDNVTIHNTAETIYGVGIYNLGEKLTILLIGNNSVTAEKSVGLWNGKDNSIIFTGNGSLIINASTTANNKDYQKGIFNRGSITVNNCTLEVSAGEYGLCDGYWIFNHCNVRVKGEGMSDDQYAGSISWVWDNKPEFRDCDVTGPAGTYWKEFQDGEYTYYTLFGKDNKVVTDWVTIAPDPASINTPIVNTTNQNPYTLSGVRVSDNLNKLPKGIYIINNKKVIKQ